MDPYPNVTPYPALPAHLDPYRYSPPMPIGRRFDFHNSPSPLRQSYTPGDSLNHPPSPTGQELQELNSRMADNRNSYAGSSAQRALVCSSESGDAAILGPPPGLEHVDIRNRFPEKIREGIDAFHSSVHFAFDSANKGKFTEHIKNLTLESTGLCLKMIQYYAQDIEEQLKVRYSSAAAAELEALEVEFRGLIELRRHLEILASRRNGDMSRGDGSQIRASTR